MHFSARLGKHLILIVHQYHLSRDNILGIIDAADQTSELIQALCLQHQHEIVLAKNSAYVQDAFFAPQSMVDSMLHSRQDLEHGNSYRQSDHLKFPIMKYHRNLIHIPYLENFSK
jgi:GTP:adenosylcobinamide-phosphate guanylyltransferase